MIGLGLYIRIQPSMANADSASLCEAIKEYIRATEGLCLETKNDRICLLHGFVPYSTLYKIQEIIEQHSLSDCWCQFIEATDDPTKRIGAFMYQGKDIVYDMQGSLTRGKALEDVARMENPSFDIECPRIENGKICWLYDENQLYIRKYEENKLVLMLDGIIKVDNRSIKGEYFMLDD